MRLLFIVCEANIEERVLHALIQLECPGYTRFTGAVGFGKRGRREGSPIWPGLNALIISAVPDELEDEVLTAMQSLEAERASGVALKVFSTDARELL